MNKQNPQPVTFDCKERVAFDMMKLLAELDTGSITERIKNPKKYIFDLYSECWAVVSGGRAGETEPK